MSNNLKEGDIVNVHGLGEHDVKAEVLFVLPRHERPTNQEILEHWFRGNPYSMRAYKKLRELMFTVSKYDRVRIKTEDGRDTVLLDDGNNFVGEIIRSVNYEVVHTES